MSKVKKDIYTTSHTHPLAGFIEHTCDKSINNVLHYTSKTYFALMPETKRKNVYFASDFHLGVDFQLSSIEREKKVVAWLHEIAEDAKAIYLVGDIFDFWFEYKSVIPKGYVRLLGTLVRLVDSGIEIHYFKGNHDMWIYDYFEKELGLIVHDHGGFHDIDQLKFYITHGDGIGKGDRLYKVIKKLLRNRFAQKLFALIHPTLGLSLMRTSSSKSRDKSDQHQDLELESNILEYANQLLSESEFSFFICGHIHSPKIKNLKNKKSQYCNLGDWMTHFTYARWNGKQLELKTFQ